MNAYAERMQELQQEVLELIHQGFVPAVEPAEYSDDGLLYVDYLVASWPYQ